MTHDKNIALQADRIIRISDGKVTQDERQVTRAAVSGKEAGQDERQTGRKVEES